MLADIAEQGGADGYWILGDLVAYVVGLGIEREWGSTVSLWAFLLMYFLSLWVAWLLAVWMTKPKAELASAATPPPRGRWVRRRTR